jgi:hypothetical protein
MNISYLYITVLGSVENIPCYVEACAGTPNLRRLFTYALYASLTPIMSELINYTALDRSFNTLQRMAGGPQRVLLALSDRPCAI